MPEDNLDGPIVEYTKKYPWWEYTAALRSMDPVRIMDKSAMGVPLLEKVNQSHRVYALLKMLRDQSRRPNPLKIDPEPTEVPKE